MDSREWFRDAPESILRRWPQAELGAARVRISLFLREKDVTGLWYDGEQMRVYDKGRELRVVESEKKYLRISGRTR